jgi:23S rRNA (adenine2503-C2)-methyltransferase
MADTTFLTSADPGRLEALLAEWGEPTFRVKQILEWIYQRKVTDPSGMTNLPAGLRDKLRAAFPSALPQIARQQGSKDTTRKFLLKLHDGRYVETVLIPASPALYGNRSDRRTLCVSSQVGCAYACGFCASGLAGFTRNLDAGEIVAQLTEVERTTGEKVNNLVFMGMGEPLANLNHLVTALTIFNASWGLGIGSRQMTVSTSGLAPQIRRLADMAPPVRLAISLHGATDEVRSKIMPVNNRYPLSELFESLEYWLEKRKQMITFEFILIEGVNDSLGQARELVTLARRVRAKVNLIPYNTVEGLPWARPSLTRQRKFLDVLERAGVVATLRREKGHDIDAACGQLRLREEGYIPGEEIAGPTATEA